MFKKTADKIVYPEWVTRVPRYKTLDVLDRLLTGTFYDHLKYAFFDEKNQAGDPVLLEDRRPSAQFRLPGMVARWSARKLFAGRHRPKLRLPGLGDDKPKGGIAKPKAGSVKPAAAPAKSKGPSGRKQLAPLNKLLRRARFWQKMGEAVYFGSVGSVAVTFKVEGEGDDAQVALTIWKAKYCKPSFDEFNNLSQLRVQYTTAPAQLRALGITTDMDGHALEDVKSYWFIRDYLTDGEVTYRPIVMSEWNPVDGFVGLAKEKNKQLQPITDIPNMVVTHDLGFVPAHWFTNLSGGDGVDGACTWGDAIPNAVELDYTLSQLGRGIRYNSAPQLVLIGNLQSGSIERGPMTALQMQAGYKDEDGQTVGEGDAKLLEMTGAGVDKALSYIDHLRNYALEQIAASRKDPDKMKAPLSGRAMEYLDEDSNDLVGELRSQYGDDGALPLVKKIALAAKVLPTEQVGTLSIQWPRMFQPTPDEVFALVQAFVLAVDPMKKTAPGTPGMPAAPATATGAGKPAVPPTDPVSPNEDEQLLTVAEARAYLLMNLDMGMLDLSLEDDAEDEEADVSPTPPALGTSPVPDPLELTEDPSEAGNGDGDDPTDPAVGGGIHGPSFVDA